MARILSIAVLAGLWTAIQTTPAAAQFTAERMFDWLDSNEDGVIDADEAASVRFGPMREALERVGGRPLNREQFTRVFEEAMPRRDDSARSDRSDRESDDRRRGSSRSSREAPKPRERIAPELPAAYREGDLDGDGQIALHEWIQWKSRAAIGEFLKLDRNQDGFLTPHELIVAEKANGANGNGSGGSSGPGSTLANRATTPVSRSTPPPGSSGSGAASSPGAGSRSEQASSESRRPSFGEGSGRDRGRTSDDRGRSGGSGEERSRGDDRSRGGEDRFRGPGGGPGRFFQRRP